MLYRLPYLLTFLHFSASLSFSIPVVFSPTGILKLRRFAPPLLSFLFYFSLSVYTTLNLNLIAEFLTSLPVTPNAAPCLQPFLLPPRIVFPVTKRPPRPSRSTLAALSLFRFPLCPRHMSHQVRSVNFLYSLTIINKVTNPWQHFLQHLTATEMLWKLKV